MDFFTQIRRVCLRFVLRKRSFSQSLPLKTPTPRRFYRRKMTATAASSPSK
jgi:hypothetical protein